ncbi:MAG: N-carbamoylputrescine amidase [Burkholderiales bacterium]|nr:N-carbamoylputrescine amidase [Burkholderiales bacterium]
MQLAVRGWNREDNVAAAERLVREAAGRGARLVLLPELFELPYFCTEQDARHFDLALPIDEHPTIRRFARLAAELKLVLPVSVFERAGQAFFNTVALLDADGSLLGIYRKTHIPDGPGYNEKFYFSPGDTGFRVWQTHAGRIGVGICWDQWFPECARAMALMGAEILLYPTAIGSEPQDPALDSSGPWRRVMQGHAVANGMPVVAANRIGRERGRDFEQTYYGSSFIAGADGEILQSAGRDEEAVLVQALDLDELARRRAAWGLFRDRRPEAYAALAGLDGRARR